MMPLTSTSGCLARLLLPRRVPGLTFHMPKAAVTTTFWFASQPPHTPNGRSTSVSERPKRPISPYLRFIQDYYSQGGKVERENFGKQIGEQWRALPDEQRAAYQQEYKKLWAEYLVKEQDWSALSKPASFPERPKRPLPSYIQFVQDYKVADQASASPQLDNLSMAEKNRYLSQQWKALPEEQRAAYGEQFQTEFAEYSVRKKAWLDLLKKQYPAEAEQEILKELYVKALSARRYARTKLGVPVKPISLNHPINKGPGGQKNEPPEALREHHHEVFQRYKQELADWTKRYPDKAKQLAEHDSRVSKAKKELHQASLVSPTVEAKKQRRRWRRINHDMGSEE